DFNGDGSSDVAEGVLLANGVRFVSVLLNTAGTTVTLSSSPNPSKLGQSVTFSSTVAATLAGQPPVTGTITFMSDLSILGTMPLVNGAASLSTSSLTLGSHNITALYNGDRNYNPHSSPGLIQVITQ